MKIRRYTEVDDPALIALERQCPRGAPEPFVHYRFRFADRAALFKEHVLLLIESSQGAVAVTAAGIKNTHANGKAVRLAYIFDVRVAPSMRRQGLASVLLESVEDELLAMGCDGAYAHIVATNRASLTLFANLGYQRRRQLRYLTYQPMPLFFGDPVPAKRYHQLSKQRRDHFAHYDLFTPDVVDALLPYEYERWESLNHDASLSFYNQSLIFQQYPAHLPWPTPEQVLQRGRHWRLFNPQGNPASLETIFTTLRDQAVSQNINKISMLVDAEDPIPSFFYAETSAQREYVIVTRSFTPRWDGSFGRLVYCDTREL